MAGAVIGALRAELSAGVAGFVQDMGKAGAASGRFRRDFEKNATATGRAMGGMGKAAAAAGTALAAVFTVQAIRGSLDYAASIGEVATQVGVTARELQVFRFIGTQVNVTQEEIEKSLAKLTQTIGKAALGASEQKKTFDALGISLKDAEGNTRATGAIMEDIADKIAAIPDPTKRAAVMVQLFGRAGQKMLPAFENGAAGIRQYADEAERLGLVLDDAAIAKADAAADKIEALNKQLMVKLAGTVADNADSILTLANAIASVAGAVTGFLGSDPQKAGARMGALAGGRIGGLPGAAVGAIGGAALGTGDVNKQWEGSKEIASKSMFGWLAVPFQSRQTLAKAGEQRLARRNAARPAAAPPGAGAPKPPAAPVFDVPDFLSSSGGAGGANKIAAATKQMRNALADMREELNKGFDDINLPESAEKAEALRRKIEDISTTARESGVGVAAFSGEIATLRAKVAELESAGLEKEAQAFTRAVEKQAAAVGDFAKGGLTDFEAHLADIDDRYDSLREAIEKQIEENAALASMNATAARSMELLKGQLVALEAAHQKATEAAKAQHAAEQAIADLHAEREMADISGQIADLKDARGDNGFVGERAAEMQRVERELNAERVDAALKLRELEAERAEAERVGDVDAVHRLGGIIDLQRQYFDLVSDTTAEQVVQAQRTQDAFDDFQRGLSDTLTNVATGQKATWQDLMSSFNSLAKDLFIRPFIDQLTQGLASMMSGTFSGGGGGGGLGGMLASLGSAAMSIFGGGAGIDTSGFASAFQALPLPGIGAGGGGFAGGFATGGVIPRGQWGIVGERGPESIYAGKGDLTVYPNSKMGGGMTQVFNISTPDANSFRASQRQIARQGRQKLAMA